MCVIAVCNGDKDCKRPTDEAVEAMFDTNGDGAGIAWRDGGVVRWEKGLGVERIKELCRTLPFPFVAHFRIGTVGGKRESLTHPFPIDKDASLDLKGTTKGYVLFHNGHWGKWQEKSEQVSAAFRAKIPMGKWSDSRAMAWAASYYGIGWLEFLEGERTCVFAPNDLDVTGLWTRVDGVWVSNKHWEAKKWTQVGGHGCPDYASKRLCLIASCQKERIVGAYYCVDHKHLIVESSPPHVIELTDKDIAERVLSGGDPTEIPFALATRLYETGWNGVKLSRNKWKKARKAHEARLVRERIEALQKEAKTGTPAIVH